MPVGFGEKAMSGRPVTYMEPLIASEVNNLDTKGKKMHLDN